jgi:transposase
MQAAQMFEQGMGPPQVARELRVSHKSACAWHRAWQVGGAAALASKGPAGQSCRLSQVQLQRLESELDVGPAAHGWADQRWTLDRVAELIGKLFTTHYSQRGVSLLLHRLGWSPQASAHRATERDEDAVATWVKQTWPQVKERRRPRTGGSASKTRPARS